MKKVIAIVALAALASSANAQLSSLPQSYTNDSVTLNTSLGLNAGVTHWDNPLGLAAYKFASDDNLGAPKPGTPDNALGLNWSPISAQVLNLLDQTNTKGGIIRTIFVGESAGWLNDFGYSYNGIPSSSSSYTVFKDIQAKTGTPYTTNVTFGTSFDISFLPGTVGNFDFWLNGVGNGGYNAPSSSTTYGGVYTAFHPTNSSPNNTPGNVKITTTGLAVSTWIAALGTWVDVPTYFVGFEDWRTDLGADKDYNDFVFAVQFLKPDGTPFNPVPEPSTYGLLGAAALLGLVVARRFRTKK